MAVNSIDINDGYYWNDFLVEFQGCTIDTEEEYRALIDNMKRVVVFISRASKSRIIVKLRDEVHSIQDFRDVIKHFRYYWCLIDDTRYTLRDIFIDNSIIFRGELPQDYVEPSKRLSRAMRYIVSLLELEGIRYSLEMRYKNCRHKNTLPFDILLIDYNAIIEYDGSQHFNGYYNKGDLLLTRKRDLIKTEFCIDNGISLLRIAYDTSKSDMGECINLYIALLNDVNSIYIFTHKHLYNAQIALFTDRDIDREVLHDVDQELYIVRVGRDDGSKVNIEPAVL